VETADIAPLSQTPKVFSKSPEKSFDGTQRAENGLERHPMATLAKRADHRREERDSRFSGEFTCRLIPNDNEGKIIPIRPIDVSRRGLGFLVREPLKTGGFFWLEIGNGRYRVELAYCGNHLGIDNLFRAGLFLREADGDLSVSCVKAGLLSDDNHAYNP
jgi:hypothetical protein